MPFIVRLITTLLLMILTVSIGNFLINGKNRIKTGIIVNKCHVPGYSKNSPDMYMLAIQGEKRGKTVVYWKTVSKTEYSKYNSDMQYP